jgi:hypothetical protein
MKRKKCGLSVFALVECWNSTKVKEKKRIVVIEPLCLHNVEAPQGSSRQGVAEASH